MSTSWLQQLRRQRMRNNLKDERFTCLFDTAPDKEWISLDCETSSLNPQQAEILSIAAIPVEGNRICLSHALELTVKPEHPIEAASIPILYRCPSIDRLLPGIRHGSPEPADLPFAWHQPAQPDD